MKKIKQNHLQKDSLTNSLLDEIIIRIEAVGAKGRRWELDLRPGGIFCWVSLGRNENVALFKAYENMREKKI